jgi:hypothetical protein
MSDWYYSHDGQQKGPVPVSELERLADDGEFDPEKDLIWREGMADWKPAASVPELQFRARGSTEIQPSKVEALPQASGPGNPYASPAVQSVDHYPTDGSDLPDIEPGSEPIIIGAVIGRAFELTKRHFGMVLAIGVIMYAISSGVSLVMDSVDSLTGYTPADVSELGFSTDDPTTDALLSNALDSGSILNQIVCTVVNVFLGLGITRVGLNIIDGKPYTIGTLFSQSSVTIRATFAQVLFVIMVGLGTLLLIFPGIYLGLRFGQYQNAIVDKNMGIFEAFGYSAHITQGTKMPLFGLYIMMFLIILGGALALVVGLIFAIPLMTAVGLVGYRWMQHGSAVTADR